MCLRIRSGAVTLFAAITIWSVLSTGAMPVEWPVRITGMEPAPVTATEECRRPVRAMQLRVRQDTALESRQDIQFPAMQRQVIQPRERCISPALPPDNLGTAHARALRAPHVGGTPPSRRPQLQPLRLQFQPPHSVMHAGKR